MRVELKKVYGITCVILALLATVFSAAFSEASDETGSGKATAVTVNGTDHSLAEFNYYFNSWYASFTEENSAYLSYMFDEAKSLKEQDYEDGRTWFDFFADEALLSMQQILTLSEEAEKAGYELSGQKREEIAQVQETVAGFAKTLGMETEEYLAYFYGEGMDEALFEKCLTDARLADGYAGMLRSSIDPADDEIEAYYRDHVRDYTTARYERFFARACAMGTVPTEEESAAAKKMAEEIRQQVAEGTSLKEAAQPYADRGKYLSFDDASYIEGSVYGDWLFDAERRDGDLFLVEDANGWYVMVFHGLDEADYPTAHVLDAYFPLDETAGTVDEQLEASCLEAEAFRDEWVQAGSTRDAFVELAARQAEKSGTAADLASVTRGQFEKNITKWLFDAQRSEGDCEILYSEEGFHVMYYDGTGEEAWIALAREDLQEQRFQAWFDDLTEKTEVIRHEDVLAHAGGY
ncbi:MAG: peptidylprolyl isomerase [Lachnospiraceae bacterium]|nr:peptidylprolyl isomerase [Lachnospiraceae bacterium]